MTARNGRYLLAKSGGVFVHFVRFERESKIVFVCFEHVRKICFEPGKEGYKDDLDPVHPYILPFLVFKTTIPKTLTFPSLINGNHRS